MSRSFWAWTDGRMPAGAAVRGAGERSGLEDQACLGRGALFGVVSSTKRFVVLVAAGLLFVDAAPASALADSKSGSQQKSQSTRPEQQAAAAGHAGDVVLAEGSGYFSRCGSRPRRVLQRRLVRAGFAPGPVDGRYGPLTEAAVSRFQTAHGLQVDGIAGPRTFAQLEKSSTTGRRRTPLNQSSRPKPSPPPKSSSRPKPSPPPKSSSRPKP